LKRLEELEAIEAEDNFQSYSKKMESQLRREMRKIRRNLEGIRNMDKLPGALVIIDVNRERNALLEAKKLGIPTVCLIDTDGNPELADIPIPGNDDSMRSIDVVIRELCVSIAQAKTQRVERAKGAGEGDGSAEGGEGGEGRRRSSRAQFRAEDGGGGSSGEGEAAEAATADANAG
jgi:small subunit ribosomal protein S2